MSRRGQASLEMTAALIGALLLLFGSFKIFLWVNERVIQRHQRYEATRGGMGGGNFEPDKKPLDVFAALPAAEKLPVSGNPAAGSGSDVIEQLSAARLKAMTPDEINALVHAFSSDQLAQVAELWQRDPKAGSAVYEQLSFEQSSALNNAWEDVDTKAGRPWVTTTWGMEFN